MSVLIATAARFHPSWRAVATLLLLALTLPVFVVGSLLAIPVLLAVGGAEGIRRLWLLHHSRRAGPC